MGWPTCILSILFILSINSDDEIPVSENISPTTSVSKQFSAWMSQSTLLISRGSVVEWSETLGMWFCLRRLVLLFLVSAHVLIYMVFVWMERTGYNGIYKAKKHNTSKQYWLLHDPILKLDSIHWIVNWYEYL